MADAAPSSDLNVLPMFTHESLYVGVDIGKHFHVAGFLSPTLLGRHERFEACPALKFDQSREGFRLLIDRISSYVPPGLRKGSFPTLRQLVHLQELAAQSIGTKDVNRQGSLVFEQTQLIKELRLIQEHIEQIDTEIQTIVEHSREGQILLSMQVIGVVQAAMIIAALGSIANFNKASELKAYFGWAPQVDTSGISLDKTKRTIAGKRSMRQVMFLVVCNAIGVESEWSHLYERLVPQKCRYDERTRTYKGKLRVMARSAGQIISMSFAFLKRRKIIFLPPK
jgi:hypothetical protein